MAIAFGATGQSGQATDNKQVYSFNLTIAGDANRAVFVGICGRQGGTGELSTNAPAFNGTPMTLVQAQGWNVASGYVSGIWVIKNASLPAAGTYAVTWTAAQLPDAVAYGLVAVYATGVNQTTPVSGAVGGNNTDATPTLTIASALGNAALTVNMMAGDPASATLVCDGTEIIRNIVANGDSHIRCIMQQKPGAASVVMAPTQSGVGTWFESGASIAAAGSGGGSVAAYPAGVLAGTLRSPLYSGNMTS